jgi:hypothetical protein
MGLVEDGNVTGGNLNYTLFRSTVMFSITELMVWSMNFGGFDILIKYF